VADSIFTTHYNRPQFLATNENLGSDARAVIWEGLAVVDVEVSPSAAVTDFPLVLDDPKDYVTTQEIQAKDLEAVRILQPTRIKVIALIKDISILDNIISTFKKDDVTVSINTKSILTKNLVLTEVSVSQSAEMVSASKVEMTFEQAQPPLGSGYVPEQAADASVYGIGTKDPEFVTPLASLTKVIKSSLGRVPVTIFGPLLNNKGGPFTLNSLSGGMLA
jgi:hypothetical protein